VSLRRRLAAAAYDPFVRRAHGLEAERAALLAEVHGAVLEIGAGTGLNRRHYAADAEVTFAEPDPYMARRIPAPVVPAPAEELPFADGSFDVVVSTLVLCGVDDVGRSLAEVRRVLRPGGRLVFLEHVRAPDGSRLARAQDRLNPVWRAVAGCDCNRDTLASLEAAGFVVDARVSPFAPPFAHPVIAGAAALS